VTDIKLNSRSITTSSWQQGFWGGVRRTVAPNGVLTDDGAGSPKNFTVEAPHRSENNCMSLDCMLSVHYGVNSVGLLLWNLRF